MHLWCADPNEQLDFGNKTNNSHMGFGGRVFIVVLAANRGSTSGATWIGMYLGPLRLRVCIQCWPF